MPCDKMSDLDDRHIRLSHTLANAKMQDHTKVAFAILKRLFSAAVAAADPLRVVPPALPKRPPGTVTVLGAGKAAAAMARAVEQTWGPPLRGLVVVPDGYALPLAHIEVATASHPVPDERGEAAAKRMMQMASALGPEDFLLVLLSGGGSALLPLPVPGLSLREKQAITRALLASGADIHAINTVRRRLSLIKGGGLLNAAHPARVLTLAISDVVGNDPLAIASGPTVPDDTPAQIALEICARHDVPLPPGVCRLLKEQADLERKGPPTDSGFAPFDHTTRYPHRHTGESRYLRPSTHAFAAQAPGFRRGDENDGNIVSCSRPFDSGWGERHESPWTYRIIATPERALLAAAAMARRMGLAVMHLGAHITGEARQVARRHARLAGLIAGGHHALRPPAVILSGGELTVTLGERPGAGGPNAEYALALGLALWPHRQRHRIHALAADTDGRDGPGDVAGAFLAPDTLSKARLAGIDPLTALQHHDSHAVFRSAEGLHTPRHIDRHTGESRYLKPSTHAFAAQAPGFRRGEEIGGSVVSQSVEGLFRTGPTYTNVNDFRAILIT